MRGSAPSRVMGAVTVGGHSAWDVLGLYTRGIGVETAHFQVNVYIDEVTSRFLMVTEKGRVTTPAGESAAVSMATNSTAVVSVIEAPRCSASRT